MHFTPRIRRLAILTASALVAGSAALSPATTAQAADPFSGLVISALPANVPIPAASGTVAFTVSFKGPAVSNDLAYAPRDAAYNGPSLKVVTTNGVKTVSAPWVFQPIGATYAPGTPLKYTMNLSPYQTPGRYRLTVPMEMRVWNKVKGAYDKTYLAATAEFNLVATPAVTVAQSVFNGRGKFSKKSKWSWTYSGPEYLKGASIKVYYQANGKKKFVVVASSKLNANGDASFKGRKGTIRKSGKVYYQLGSVPFSPQTRSGVYKTKKY